MLCRWKITVDNQKELMVEIIRVFKEKNTHIISMEVASHIIFVKFNVVNQIIFEELEERLLRFPGIRGIYVVGALPQENIIRFEDIIFQSSKMANIVNLTKKVAPLDCSVLILGDSGTGKELFARAIHQNSPRKVHDFIPINCAALPENLLESELFGYEEGAFSGAKKGGSKGLFEHAHNGTLFLDEIGEFPPVIQAKLLRVLQDKRVRRVGGKKFLDVDVRIIAATNRDLEEMVQKGAFREDLYYRLNVITLKIPSLRERQEDIPVLINYMLARYNQKFGKELEISPESMTMLLSYKWPGNVRELENILERAVILAEGDEIRPVDLMIGLKKDSQERITFNDEMNIDSLKEHLAGIEKAIIKSILDKEGSARAAAKVLGLSHTAILKKIHNYGLSEHLKSYH